MKNVLITGASRGIGFELAQLFAKNKYNVLAISRNIKPLKDLKYVNLNFISVDISEEKEIQRITSYVKEELKHVDILINNAGKLVHKPFQELTSSYFLEVYKVNVFGVAELIRQLLPYFSKKSHVVNISSLGGVQGSVKFPGLAAYSSSKGALLTLTELLAEEYKDQKIAFNALALGAVQTEMLDEAFPGYKAPVSAQEMAAYIYNFALTGNKFYNGKILQVSSTTP